MPFLMPLSHLQLALDTLAMLPSSSSRAGDGEAKGQEGSCCKEGSCRKEASETLSLSFLFKENFAVRFVAYAFEKSGTQYPKRRFRPFQPLRLSGQQFIVATRSI